MKNGLVLLAKFMIIAAMLTGCQTAKVTHLTVGNDKAEKGIAASFPGDIGISKNKAVIFSSAFEDDFAGWTSVCATCDIVNGDSLRNPTKVLRITATKNRDTGGDVILRLPEGEDEMYLRFYAYFPKATVTPHHFVKIISYPIPYFGGQAGKKPGANKYMVLGIEPTKENTWNYYAYWMGMHSWQTYRGDPDTTRGPNAYYGNVFKPGDQVPFKRDSWVCVEARVKLNDPGNSNGLLAFWIDGKKIGEWTKGYPTGTWRSDQFVTSGADNIAPKPFEGFIFRTVDTLKINQVSLQWYVSQERANEGTAEKNTVYFDHIVVARKYIGIKE